MKKIVTIILALTLCLSLGACGVSEMPTKSNQDNTESSAPTSETPEEEPKTAEEIINTVKDSGLPVGTIIVYTEETDSNNLLGRPNQYTSKINFADTRIDQYDEENNPVGGTVEVFINGEDATARKAYIEALSSIRQYIYQYKNVLVRIDFDLTPEQAEEYHLAFKDILE